MNIFQKTRIEYSDRTWYKSIKKDVYLWIKSLKQFHWSNGKALWQIKSNISLIRDCAKEKKTKKKNHFDQENILYIFKSNQMIYSCHIIWITWKCSFIILIKLYPINKAIKSNYILSIMISKTLLSLRKHVYDSLCSHLFPLEFPVAFFLTNYLYTGIRRKKKEKTQFKVDALK